MSRCRGRRFQLNPDRRDPDDLIFVHSDSALLTLGRSGCHSQCIRVIVPLPTDLANAN